MLDMRFESRLEQADVTLSGIAAEFLQRGVADAALGRGDGADEGRVVVGVGDQPQIGDDVLDLGAVEERCAAADGVGNALGAQLFLEGARQMIAAIQDGVVGKPRAMLELVRHQLHHHTLGFVLFIA